MQDNTLDKDIIARFPGSSYQDLLDRESVAVPEALREDTAPYLGSEDLDLARWTSREFHELEVEKMWRRTWQVTCRESQLKNPGDYFVYEIVNDSILLTRTEAGEIRGFYNSCLHRGRSLKRGSGSASEFRCPYHGFTWNLDGSFQGMPCEWDFAHVDHGKFCLPQVAVATWGGWVFINMADEPQDFAEYLDILPQHFKRWSPEDTYVAVHVEKVIRANWKTVLEAFIESYHALQTHPQILCYSGIDNSQYDIWGDNISRTITTMGTVNPTHTGEFSQQDCINALLGTSYVQQKSAGDMDDGFEARDRFAALSFEQYSAQSGLPLAELSTHSEIMDSILYFIFPNFAPWAGFLPNISYRHRPNGDDHESCIMDIFVLNRFPPGQERPADASPIRLGADQPFADAVEVLGEGLARVFDQDAANLPQVQRGMKASKKGTATLANYQEVRIRHFHQTLDKYLRD